MTEQTIQSQDIKVSDVFQAFYSVPDYQREYIWETKQVEQLLNDINTELSDNDSTIAPEYFIGSTVVCPGENGVFDLIDGQQRMTTLFLTLCAIRDRMKKLGAQPPGALDPQIKAPSTDVTGKDHFRYRLSLQYEDSRHILIHIAENTFDNLNVNYTRSTKNIFNAYNTALNFLTQEFENDTEQLRRFYGYLINNVKLIRIQTKDVAKALKIFETINDRGVGLDSMDLLKNLLFMKASNNEFEKLKVHWKELQDAIFDMGEKPLRFLRYFIFSRYDVDVLREDEIYGWFARHETLCRYAKDPIGFAKELLWAAKAYGNFWNGNDKHGKKSRHLENLQILGGKAARHHLILLLAGCNLPDDLFDRLAHEVEELFFIYVITREPTTRFERIFASWATELRKITNEADLDDFIMRRFLPAKADLSARFDDAFKRLHGSSVQRYRLRYILAKLAQHVDFKAYGETEGTKWLSRYTGQDFEIEHIFPQHPSEEATTEFGFYSDDSVSDRLGNLTLIEKSINSSLGNRPYSQKRDIYLQSQLLFTKIISERPRIGTNTKIDSAVEGIDPAVKWNETAIEKRQDNLTMLARLAWNLPKPSSQ